MIFGEDDLQLLRDEPVKGIMGVCSYAFARMQEGEFSQHEVSVLLEAYALISVTLEETNLEVPARSPSLNGNLESDGQQILAFLRIVEATFRETSVQLTLKSLRSRYAAALGKSFVYEFTEGDLERVQVLLNELRKELSTSTLFDQAHRSRLLTRLERLQQELHKKISDLDRFWGLFGEAGVMLGKFGKDAKPFVDRIKEIADIVWRTQGRSEELPSAAESPALPPPCDS
jgi:hypothetical protein